MWNAGFECRLNLSWAASELALVIRVIWDRGGHDPPRSRTHAHKTTHWSQKL